MAVADDVHRLRIQGGGDLSRSLGIRKLDLDADQSYFLSLFIRSDADAGNQAVQEFLDVNLLEGSTQKASFGVGSRENFVAAIGTNTASGPDNDMIVGTSYYVLAKIVASDAGDDEILLTWYNDAGDLPGNEDAIGWQVSKSADLGGMIDSIQIAAGANATWNVDGLRIGTTFESVVFTDGVLPDILGDLDRDGDVDLNDWIEFKRNYGSNTSGLVIPDQYDLGDLDASGWIDLEDVEIFREIYDSFKGPGAFAAIAYAVPEPSAFMLLAAGTGALLRVRYDGIRR